MFGNTFCYYPESVTTHCSPPTVVHRVLQQKLGDIQAEFDDPLEVFHIVLNHSKHTEVEGSLLSILQHLLIVRDDPEAK